MDTTGLQGPYLLKINPLRTKIGSNIRQVREAFVEELVSNIKHSGWNPSSFPTVYEPVEGVEARSLSRDVLDTLEFSIMDGSHRLCALRTLQRDPAVPEFDANTLINVRVVPHAGSTVQDAIDAATENTLDVSTRAEKTLCDEIWTMLLIRSSVLGRIEKFSSEIAEPYPIGAPPNRPKRGSVREQLTPLKSLSELPHETENFIDSYDKDLYQHLLYPKTLLRRPFDPVIDMKHVTIAVLVHMCSEATSRIAKENPMSDKGYAGVKWRIATRMVPGYVKVEEPKLGEDLPGGNMIVTSEGQDLRLWNYMCLVNNRLKSKSRDLITYGRLYTRFVHNNAYISFLCGLVLMTQMVANFNGGDADKTASSEVTRKRSRRAGTIQDGPSSGINPLCGAVCAVYRQFNSAASLVSGTPSLQTLLGPFMTIERSSLQLTSLSEQGVWVSPVELTGLQPIMQTVGVHPELGKPYTEMTPQERSTDADRRILARSFIEDIERLVNLSQQSSESLFGPFDETSRVTEILPVGQLTSYVVDRFSVLKTYGFTERYQDAVSDGTGQGNSALADEFDEITQRQDGDAQEGQRKRARQSDHMVPRNSPGLETARQAAVDALARVDKVSMRCSSFIEWGESAEARNLRGTVGLVLTDPPYNTRRTAGAANSGHDSLTHSDMLRAGDLIAELLRPNGQAYIFCSMLQFAEWHRVLTECGGGGVLAVGNSAEAIVRAPDALRSMGRFRVHRANGFEVAIHAYKRPQAQGSGANAAGLESRTAYSQVVGFGNPSIELCSDNKMPPYVGVIDSYVPPRAPELLRHGGMTLRPEQKSVKLLRDLIRLFAPCPADIVVDLFAGTMSTVAAALLEGHPVYACEIDSACFAAAEARIHQLQYRRGAAGLIPRLMAENVALLRDNIPPKSDAPDLVDTEGETRQDDVVMSDDE
jgi:hypothetical protein